MAYLNGKMKALTFSYDDAATQDERLVALFNKYGMKCTFNVNHDLLGRPGELLREGVYVRHDKIERARVPFLYDGHEVATHSLTHPSLTLLDDDAIVREIENDRIKLSELVGYEVVGHAYPNGHFDARVADILRNRTGVKYARTVTSTYSFEEQTDLFTFNPTVYDHRETDEMFRLGEEFLAMTPTSPKLFYIWGHSFEFDIDEKSWYRFEEFLEMMSGRADIFYGTNKECLL